MTESLLLQDYFENTNASLRLDDHTLDQWSLKQRQNFDAEASFGVPTAGLGLLDTLPVEILQEVISSLDLEAVYALLSVNKAAHRLVITHPEYAAIQLHAPGALSGVRLIKTARWISCRKLFDKLCTSACEKCGDFGGYLYLVTCIRVCFLCFSEHRDYLPLSVSLAMHKFQLKRFTVEGLPCVQVMPGRYAPNNLKIGPSRLVDYHSALMAGINLHGSEAAMQQAVTDATAVKLRTYNARKARALSSDPRSRGFRKPYWADPMDGQSANPARFIAIVRAPWFNRQLRQTEAGRYCQACRITKDRRRSRHWRRIYSADSFREHMAECGEIIRGIHVEHSKP